MRTILPGLIAGLLLGTLDHGGSASATSCSDISNTHSSQITCCPCSYDDTSSDVFKNNGDSYVNPCVVVTNTQNIASFEYVTSQCEGLQPGSTHTKTITAVRNDGCQGSSYFTDVSLGGPPFCGGAQRHNHVFGTLCCD